MKRALAATSIRALLPFAGIAAIACAPTRMQLIVHAAPTANRGLPMYMLVRSVDEAKYMTETYDAIATKVVEPDTSVLKAAEIFPGRDKSFVVKLPESTPVAVYFLFTDPGIRWRALIEPPYAGRCVLRIEGNEIQDMTLK